MKNKVISNYFKTKFLKCALVLILSGSFLGINASAQNYNDLDPIVLNQLESIIFQECDFLKNQYYNNAPNVNGESNINLVQYYNDVMSTFKDDNTTLRDAFVANLVSLQRGQRINRKLFDAMFTGRVLDAFTLPINAPSSSNDLLVNYESPLTPGFENVLRQIDISNGDMSSISQFIQFVRDNK